MSGKIDIYKNSFDALRLFAAIQVLFGHTVGHLAIFVPSVLQKLIGFFPGVIIFFVISGFLITSSCERMFENGGGEFWNRCKRYTVSRFLRIYPGLWIAFLVSCLTIFIFYGFHADGKQVGIWAAAQLTVGQFYTADFLRGFGVGTPNGSLWTIVVELQFYIVIWFFYKKLKECSIKNWLFLFSIFFLINIGSPFLENRIPDVIYKLYNVTLIPYFYIFLIGVFLYLYREKLLNKILKNYYNLFLLFIGFNVLNEIVPIFPFGRYINLLSGIMLSVLTIGTAYKFGSIRLKYDISYGIYLYHMIIINIFVQIGMTGKPAYLVVITLLSVIAGFLSYRLVEYPCLRIKDRLVKKSETKHKC